MANALYDAFVGLMQQEPVDVVVSQMVIIQHILDVLGRLSDSSLEQFLAFHHQGLTFCIVLFKRCGLHAALVIKHVAVGNHGELHVLEGCAYGEHHGTGTVAKQHATVSFVPIAVFGGLLGTHNQNILGVTRLNHAVGKHQGVDKTGTSHVDVEARAGDANAFLDDAAQSWGDVLVRHIRDQKEIYLVGAKP